MLPLSVRSLALAIAGKVSNPTSDCTEGSDGQHGRQPTRFNFQMKFSVRVRHHCPAWRDRGSGMLGVLSAGRAVRVVDAEAEEAGVGETL